MKTVNVCNAMSGLLKKMSSRKNDLILAFIRNNARYCVDTDEVYLQIRYCEAFELLELPLTYEKERLNGLLLSVFEADDYNDDGPTEAQQYATSVADFMLMIA